MLELTANSLLPPSGRRLKYSKNELLCVLKLIEPMLQRICTVSGNEILRKHVFPTQHVASVTHTFCFPLQLAFMLTVFYMFSSGSLQICSYSSFSSRSLLSSARELNTFLKTAPLLSRSCTTKLKFQLFLTRSNPSKLKHNTHLFNTVTSGFIPYT